MKKRFLLLVGMFGVAIAAASFNLGGGIASATVPGTNAMMNTNTSGTTSATSGADGRISANSKFYVFSSRGTNIIASDTNNKADTFVRNLTANTVSRVSVSTLGVEADADSTYGPISETGRYVLFTSEATNLIDGTTITTSSGNQQLYMRDTKTNTTTLLSKNSSGVVANGNIIGDGISADGRFVLFESRASNLGPSVTNSPTFNLYMLDRSDNSFTILNYAYDSSLPVNNLAPNASMSCDGSLVVFQDTDSLTATTPSSGYGDSFLLDRRAGSTLTNLNVSINANKSLDKPTISCNGDYIGFSSYADNLDPDYTSASSANFSYNHVYAYDRINESVSLADKTAGGTVANTSVTCAGPTNCIHISDTGIATFPSRASNLVGAATGSVVQIFVHDVTSGVTELLSRDSGGTQGNNTSYDPAISANGSVVSYSSLSTNLVSLTDSNSAADAFTSLTGY